MHSSLKPAPAKAPLTPLRKPPANGADKISITKCKLFSHDVILQRLYHAAYTGPHGKYPDNTQTLEKIAQHVIKTYYPSFRSAPPKIEILPPSKTNYASIPPGENAPIQVPANTFESQASLGSTLGHELIHKLQKARVYGNLNLTAISGIRDNLREVEAHTWELEPNSYKWTLGSNRFLAELTEQDKAEARKSRDEYQAAARKGIDDLLGSMRADVYGPNLEKWLNTDEWTKDVWLKDPANKDWKRNWMRQ